MILTAHKDWRSVAKQPESRSRRDYIPKAVEFECAERPRSCATACASSTKAKTVSSKKSFPRFGQ